MRNKKKKNEKEKKKDTLPNLDKVCLRASRVINEKNFVLESV